MTTAAHQGLPASLVFAAQRAVRDALALVAHTFSSPAEAEAMVPGATDALLATFLEKGAVRRYGHLAVISGLRPGRPGVVELTPGREGWTR